MRLDGGGKGGLATSCPRGVPFPTVESSYCAGQSAFGLEARLAIRQGRLANILTEALPLFGQRCSHVATASDFGPPRLP